MDAYARRMSRDVVDSLLASLTEILGLPGATSTLFVARLQIPWPGVDGTDFASRKIRE
jgi:hypothetical protein